MKKAGMVLAALLIAALVGSGTAAAATKVYYHPPFGDAVYKPKRIEFHDTVLFKLHWRHWNWRRTRGRGKARVNTCIPICATGEIVHGRARLRMFDRHAEGDKLFYGCMKGSIHGNDGKTYRVRWPAGCR